MIYKAKKLYRWLIEFGIGGLWLLLRVKRLDSSEIVTLRSQRVGLLYCRPRIEDFEAVNTAFVLNASEARHHCFRAGTVVDLGANIGIATRYFLSVLPGLEITAIEPSEENGQIFDTNVHATCDGGRVKLRRCAVGPKSGSGPLVSDPGGRFDGFKVEFQPSQLKGDNELIEVLPTSFGAAW